MERQAENFQKWGIMTKGGKILPERFSSEETAEAWRNDAISVCLSQFQASYVYDYYNKVIQISE